MLSSITTGITFTIFVDRDGELKADQLEKFLALRTGSAWRVETVALGTGLADLVAALVRCHEAQSC